MATDTPTISLIGPSGLDTSAIIAALADVRRNPIRRLEAKRQKLQSQNTAFGTLRSRLEALKTKAATLDTAAELRSVLATSTNANALTATATGSAAEGSYAITVNALAQSESRLSTGVAQRTGLAVGSGVISITSGGTKYDINVAPGADLEAIRDAINANEVPVTATIINDGGPTDPYKLVLTSETTGAASGFSVNLAGFTPASAFSFSTLSTGQDASFTLNGLPITRSSNTATDVIDGVTLNLLQSGQSSTLTVSKDRTAVKNKIKELVSAFNDVLDFFKANSNADLKDTTAVLYNDTTLRSAQTTVRGVITGAVDGTGSAYNSLAAIGVTTGSDGRLSVDDTKLTNALNADFDGVISLFTTATNGIASKIQTASSAFQNNSLKSRTDGILSRIRGINTQVDQLEVRLDQYIATLQKKFSALDAIAGRLQAQGGALSALNQ
jgi:flagellar hook-associated protein 2